MDIKVITTKDGGVVQLIDKEKLMEWPVELPLLFVEYIRDKKLDSYGSAKKEVDQYLNEIMEEVAIPRLISVLKGEDVEEIKLALSRIEEISKKNIEMARPIKTYLSDLLKNKNKDVVKLAESISSNFTKAERRKELAKKRKLMQQKEKDFLEGKITAEDYAKARKDYLVLKD